jgi:signal transduction histidine kinase
VAFGRQDGEAVITVEDDGKGFDTETAQESRHGFGLTSMRERAQQIRGRLEVESTVGAGTRVVARLPMA